MLMQQAIMLAHALNHTQVALMQMQQAMMLALRGRAMAVGREPWTKWSQGAWRVVWAEAAPAGHP